MNRTCAQCGTPIKRRKFCGQPCYGQHLKSQGVKPPSRLGETVSDEVKARMSAAIKAAVPRGEAHPNWKGDAVSKKALHGWVYRVLGSPKRCEHCDTTKGWFDWANKSEEYKREVEDWLRLCRACHMKYDKTGERARDGRIRNGTVSGWKWRRNEQSA